MTNVQTRNHDKFRTFLTKVLAITEHRNETMNLDEHLVFHTNGNKTLTLRGVNAEGDTVTEATASIDDKGLFEVTDARQKLHFASSATQASKLVFLGING